MGLPSGMKLMENAKEQNKTEEIELQVRTASDFIIDVNGITLVVDTEEQFMKLFTGFQNKTWADHGFQLLKIQNSFHHEIDSKFGYRDLKCWIAVNPYQEALQKAM